ncbi:MULTISPECIES: hypothetical protein [unclassified Flavobacterium]|uniref:hypothetical protein n=1 Tax=unclassified Flavobacterium TaxID=196869 RepID=UPI001F146150|nr:MULTISPECIES: hypothetical protein [unclassified Flavobacterium]UMY64547.1 hypothetical protein MKO97_08485 [Flavobacterium sp. HJ-32-4]
MKRYRTAVVNWLKEQKIRFAVAGILLVVMFVRMEVLRPDLDRYSLSVKNAFEDQSFYYAVGVYLFVLLLFSIVAYRKRVLDVQSFVNVGFLILLLTWYCKGVADDVLLAMNTHFGKTSYHRTFTITRDGENHIYLAFGGSDILDKEDLTALHAKRRLTPTPDLYSKSHGDTIHVRYATGFLGVEFRD